MSLRRASGAAVLRRAARAARLTLLTPALLSQAAWSEGRFQPQIDVSDMRVVISYVSTGELFSLQREYGANVDRRDVRQSHRHGMSILRKNTVTGALTCNIYLPSANRPREVDDVATLSLGHELLHCMHGNYHR